MLCIVFLPACASVNKIGSIGEYDLYEASTKDAFAPNTTTLFMAKGDGKPEVVNKGAGNSIIGTLAAPVITSAGSILTARAVEEAARRIRPDETSITNEGSVSGSSSVSGSISSATGGAGGQGGSVGDINSNNKKGLFN
ncbi:MAG: hypothetical protein GY751_04560 [Bacteroidetes bacterium]|nr:hypothetical protein [Bacteroidota bacterium]